MSLFDSLANNSNQSKQIPGVVVGIVTNNQDPDGMHRVKVKIPSLSQDDESNWARVASPMTGNDRGLYFLPEVDDEVLVIFEYGDIHYPCVIGSLWNGQDTPPADNADGNNSIRCIKSRSGHVIRLCDEDGAEKIEIVDKSENNSIVFDTANNTITITADKDITLSAANGTIKLDAKNIEVKSSAESKVESGSGMDIKASETMNLKGATINLN